MAAKRLQDLVHDFLREFKDAQAGGFRAGGEAVAGGEALADAWFQFQRARRARGEAEFVRLDLVAVLRDGRPVLMGRRLEGDDPYELARAAAAWARELRGEAG